ncbi:MAG: hypothetical protein HY308_16140 [Gammaproteobacteria bacterium]|nr:hypothetical protein [Gammaproteobacteria bacterium]
MSELRELTLEEVAAIRVAIEHEIESIQLELEEHDRGINVLDEDRYDEQLDALNFYKVVLLHDFRKAERETFGLRDAANPEAGPYPGSASDTLVMLEFKEISFIRYALHGKLGHIKWQLRNETLDEVQQEFLQRELKFYEELFRVFETAETTAPKLRQVPQIAYSRRWRA